MELEDQVAYVRNFIEFLKSKLEHTTHDFEKLQGVSEQELQILVNLAAKNRLTVKGVSLQLSQVSLSTLTRLLDSLEQKQYVIRSINPEDRRSFIVEITEAGRQVVDGYHNCTEQISRMILRALSPAERLILIELYTKAWKSLRKTDENEETSAV